MLGGFVVFKVAGALRIDWIGEGVLNAAAAMWLLSLRPSEGGAFDSTRFCAKLQALRPALRDSIEYLDTSADNSSLVAQSECAVKRRSIHSGVIPTRGTGPFQPEATGAAAEATKPLKHFGVTGHFW